MRQLRAQVKDKGERHAPSRLFAVPEEMVGLLPEGGLRPGSAYALGSAGALLHALLAEPSRTGTWCGVVGMPELGLEAAHQAGVVLDRLVLVPEPGRRWLSAVAALAEVLGVVAVRPSGSVAPADAARLASRLRDREATLLVVGDWPRAEAVLRVGEPRWSGVGSGYGNLNQREVTLTITSKRMARPRSARLLLPGPDGHLGRAQTPAPARGTLRAVG